MSWDKIYQKCIESGTSGTPDAVSGTSGILDTLARILLGAIPLVFSGLSYLYWLLGVERDTFKERQNGSDKYKTNRALVDEYMRRMGYDLSGIREIQVVNRSNSSGGSESNTLKDVFGNCKVFEGVEVTGNQNYATFLEKLRTSAGSTGTGLTSDQLPLLILNTLCSGYFRSLHTIDSIREPRPRTPRTIREILYWLTSLPYCPIYRTLVPKVQEMIRRIGSKGGKSEVVFYGSDIKNDAKKLEVTTSNCAMYLLGGALVAPMVLLCIQDTIECRVGSEKAKSSIESYKLENYGNEVPIHDLYANMQFWFSYPMSETESYYLLQDCLFGLFYQLYFLMKQCLSTRTSGYGWGWCKYGDKVNSDEGGVDGTGCLSWICPVGDKKGNNNGSGGSNNKCGQKSKGNPSPLQAFLTDCLKGFTCPVLVDGESGYKDKDGKVVKYQDKLEKLRKEGEKDNSIYSECYPGFLDHRTHTMSVFGQECAVPMGFSGSFRSGGAPAPGAGGSGTKDGMVGLGIDAVLYYYANYYLSTSGLYQITRCICSLTRRVPRSTGTIFGFFYGLGNVYSSKKGSFDTKLRDELSCCPGYRNPECLMKAVGNWRGTINGHNGKCESLYGLTECDKTPTCGKYLWPLSGTLYNCLAPEFCETYVSWIVHLTWRLQSGLQKLLEEFVKIDCSKSGCTGKGGSGHCCKGGDNHGTACRCDNVVKCAGVLGLFYRFGFGYLSPGMLSKSGSSRKCDKFHQQLEKVLTESPFNKLLTQLRKFIYTTRALFGVYIGVYWSIVLLYLVYSMTVNLDILHIQSHWRSPRSYLVPLQRILADGSRKGFCTLGYFQENTGDSLLSQGISDVYL